MGRTTETWCSAIIKLLESFYFWNLGQTLIPDAWNLDYLSFSWLIWNKERDDEKTPQSVAIWGRNSSWTIWWSSSGTSSGSSSWSSSGSSSRSSCFECDDESGGTSVCGNLGAEVHVAIKEIPCSDGMIASLKRRQIWKRWSNFVNKTYLFCTMEVFTCHRWWCCSYIMKQCIIKLPREFEKDLCRLKGDSIFTLLLQNWPTLRTKLLISWK